MSDNHTSLQRHRNMTAIHSINTGPEMALRKALWKRQFRYRVNDKGLPGRPDIVLPKYRTVVFVHGCFWHGHRACKRYTIPKTNTDYWVAKIARNQERDQEVWRKLEAKGWSVIVVWECQLDKKYKDETVERVVSEIIQNGEIFHLTQEERRKARAKYKQEQVERGKRVLEHLEEVKNF